MLTNHHHVTAAWRYFMRNYVCK